MANKNADVQLQQNSIVESYGEVQIIFLGNQSYYYNISQNLINQGIFALLDFMLKDDFLEEIMYNGPEEPIKVYHKRYGMCDTSAKIDDSIAYPLISWIVKGNGKIISPQMPIFDGSLYDGSRVNITMPPASPKYCTMTIRKFTVNLITILDLIKSKTLSEEAAAFIWTAVDGLAAKPANILVVGGTGTGKTTFMNAVMMLAPLRSRIVTIEDTAELKMKHSNVLTMLSRNEQGITMDLLLKNALRQRPDRILVGEVRGPEAMTLFSAMNTGHDGCMGTLHANNARESIDRVINAPMNVPTSMLNGLDLIIVLRRISDQSGDRRIVEEITEVSASSANINFNQLYTYDAAKNTLVGTGIPSRLREKIAQAAGVTPKDFDFLIKDRAEALKAMQSLDANQTSSSNLMTLIEKNRFHWKDELGKKGFQKWFGKKVHLYT